ncbi:3-phosphoglycerate dehydrogenase [Clostridia bacterium]|nr:3-phosphoglycerate dehydrogenase [Clostridia bacterium]
MKRVLIANGEDLKISITWSPLDKILQEKLQAVGYSADIESFSDKELKDSINGYDVLVVGESLKVDKEVIEASNLKMIVKAGRFFNNIDIDAAKAKGIIVKNTPECSRNAIAELILGHIVSVSRFFFKTFKNMPEGIWDQASCTGIELSNRTLGLVGFDKTAQILAKKAAALGMKVRYWDINGKAEGFDEYEYREFNALISDSTYLSLHAEYDPAKGYIMGEKELFSMEKGGNLFNCTDGRLVDEKALLKALGATMADMHLFGAALDVFEQEPTTNAELMAHSRVSLTPHIGDSTYEANTARVDEIVDIIQKN